MTDCLHRGSLFIRHHEQVGRPAPFRRPPPDQMIRWRAEFNRCLNSDSHYFAEGVSRFLWSGGGETGLLDWRDCCIAAAARRKWNAPGRKRSVKIAGTTEYPEPRIEQAKRPSAIQNELNPDTPTGSPASWWALEVYPRAESHAVLLLLLLESDAPLIVDRPEDNLENRFITEGTIPEMREEKRRRQFVFSTRNANIPVLGEAELILGLTAEGEAVEGKSFVSGGAEGTAAAPVLAGCAFGFRLHHL